MDGNGDHGYHGLNPKTRILIETWILDAFKFFKEKNVDTIRINDIQCYIEKYATVPLKLTDVKYRKGNLSFGTKRLQHFLIALSKTNKVFHIPKTTLWKRINEEKETEEVYIPKPKYCSKCNTLLTPRNEVGWKQRSLICKPCFLKKRREYGQLLHVKETNRAKHKKYYYTHREQELLRHKNYCKTHKEAIRLRMHNYYIKNKQKICAKIREKYAIKHGISETHTVVDLNGKSQIFKVIDKRKEGFYCVYCQRFSKELGMDERGLGSTPNEKEDGSTLVFKRDPDSLIPKTKEVWRVFLHYDGCRGWN